MPDDKLTDELLDREIKTMEIYLWAKAMRTAITLDEYIQARLLQGTSMAVIRADLLEDLHTGGRIFGEFRNAVKATTGGSINRFKDSGQFSEMGVDQKYKWAAVLVKTCPDCLERHGQSKTWEEWEDEGLPRTGRTVCREHCRCMLIPDDMSVLEPIKREKK